MFSYRSYRLRDRRQKEPSTKKVNVMIRDFVKYRSTTKQEPFNGSDGITVLQFLAQVVEDVEHVELPECVALKALRHCLSGQARQMFDSAAGILPGSSGLASWSEAVQYLLRTYATDANIEKALSKLRITTQNDGEDEYTYSDRLQHAEQRAGNVYRWH